MDVLAVTRLLVVDLRIGNKKNEEGGLGFDLIKQVSIIYFRRKPRGFILLKPVGKSITNKLWEVFLWTSMSKIFLVNIPVDYVAGKSVALK